MSTVAWTYTRRADTGTTNLRVGIWLFLASEAMLFGSLFSGYVLLRAGAAEWPASRALDAGGAWLNTALLLAASAVLLPTGTRARTTRMSASSLLAAAFVTIKLFEYSAKVAAGLTPASNVLLASWFVLTGVHAAHVAGGVLANIYVMASARRSDTRHVAERLHALRLYWMFVDAVWLMLLVSFYLV